MTGRRKTGKPALELLEEAVHLLRVAPVRRLGVYYLGAAPFVLGLLYFWADMSRGVAGAAERAQAAVLVALLFIWMKTWQAVFAAELRAQVAGRIPDRWTIQRLIRICTVQGAVQPSGLLILPIALIVTLPFGVVFAFYQNMTVFGDGHAAQLRPVLKRAARQASLWQGGNHVLLLVFLLLALFLWLNMMTALLTVPGLIKTFLGIETVFTRSGWHAVLNSTFLAAAFAITYLCVDPLIKAAYVLRCFYGESLTSGEDLKVELKRNTGNCRTVAAALLIVFMVGTGTVASHAGDEQNAAATESSLAAEQLNDAIEEVLQKREFAWRLPPKPTEFPEEEPGWLMGFLQGVQKTVLNWLRSMRDLIRDLLEWLEKYFKKKTPTERTREDSKGNWMTTIQVIVVVLLVIIASAVGILFVRTWRKRHRAVAVVAEPVAAAIDVADESVAANQLPEDDWLKLARELIQQGDLRRALRALYLAGLAHLASREFISIAKFKSNREYEAELRRRAPAHRDLQAAFSENILLFDCVWYGMHQVTMDRLRDFQINLEKIRAC